MTEDPVEKATFPSPENTGDGHDLAGAKIAEEVFWSPTSGDLGLAISLGVGAFVVIMSVSASANHQTARSIDSLRPELVRATPSGSADAENGPPEPLAADRLMAIPGVNAWLANIGLGSVPKSAVESGIV